jgi:hypothetical protein
VKDLEVQESVEEYRKILGEVNAFNNFLADNNIKILAVHPECLAFYIEICEKARQVNAKCHPSLKPIWISFSINI